MCLSMRKSIHVLGSYLRDAEAKEHFITALIEKSHLFWVLIHHPHKTAKQIEPTGRKQTVTFIFM